MTRRFIQWLTLFLCNFQFPNFITGRLYTGALKNFCSPGLNCYSCPAAVLSCPLGAMQTLIGWRGFNFSFYVFGFLSLSGLFLGRAICGFLCPFGLMQELIYKVPCKKFELWRPLICVKYFVLIIFVLILPLVTANYAGFGVPAFCQYICPAGTLEAALPLIAVHKDFYKTLGTIFLLKMFMLIFVIGGSIVTYRFFCKMLCPLGAVYGLFNKISLWQMQVEVNRCIKCGECRRVCQMAVNPAENPNSNECIRCGKCLKACPKVALSRHYL